MNAIDNQPCHSYHDTDPISFEDFCLFVKERKKRQKKKRQKKQHVFVSKKRRKGEKYSVLQLILVQT